MRSLGKFASVVTGLLLSAGLVSGLAASSPAVAAPRVAHTTSATCTKASSTDTLKPGVEFTTNGKQTIGGTLTASGCKGSGVSKSFSGTVKMTSTNLTCISGAASGTFATKASNGKTSSGTLALKATSTALKFTLSGTVKKGYLKGSKIKGTFTAKPVKGTCEPGSPLTKVTVTNDGSFTL